MKKTLIYHVIIISVVSWLLHKYFIYGIYYILYIDINIYYLLFASDKYLTYRNRRRIILIINIMCYRPDPIKTPLFLLSNVRF